MKKSIKLLIVISLVLMFNIISRTNYCMAKTLNETTQIPVTGKIIFSENIDNNVINKYDVRGDVPINSSLNKDKEFTILPKTGDTDDSIYFLIVILAILVFLIFNYKKINETEMEALENEKNKNNSIN